MNRVLLFLILLENVFQMNGRYIQITAKVPIFEHFPTLDLSHFEKMSSGSRTCAHRLSIPLLSGTKDAFQTILLERHLFFLKSVCFIVSYIIKNSRNIRHPRINRPENYIFRTLLLLGYQVLRDLRERFHNIPGGS